MSPERLPYIILYDIGEEIGLEHTDVTVRFNDLFKKFFITVSVYNPYKRPATANHDPAFIQLPYTHLCIPCDNQKLIKNLIKLEDDRLRYPTRYKRQVQIKSRLLKGQNKLKLYIVNYLSDVNNYIWIADEKWDIGYPPSSFDRFVRLKRCSMSNASFLCEDIDGPDDIFVKVAFREPKRMNSKGTAFESFDSENI